MSKGSIRRPQQIPEAKMDENWQRAFERKCPACGEPLKPERMRSMYYCSRCLKVYTKLELEGGA